MFVILLEMCFRKLCISCALYNVFVALAVLCCYYYVKYIRGADFKTILHQSTPSDDSGVVVDFSPLIWNCCQSIRITVMY